MLIKPDVEVEQEKTESGIYIPQKARESAKYVQGRVVAVGPKVEGIKADEVVLYDREQGSDLSNSKVSYVLIEAEHVVAVV